MLTRTASTTGQTSLLLLLFLASCQTGVHQDGHLGQLIKTNGSLEDLDQDARPLPSISKVEEIASGKGLLGSHGSSHIYIDGSIETQYVIVHETSASRTRYKAITPILTVENGELTIDCSYVRSEDPVKGVSVGQYCRGRDFVSLDSLVDAISDEHMVSYSQSPPWFSLIDVDECRNAAGLEYAGLYFMRCNKGTSDELTSELSINIFSADHNLLSTVSGYEFSPNKPDSNPQALTFWGLDKESSHQIIEQPAR